MGQAPICCRSKLDHQFFEAMEAGDLEMVESALRRDPEILHRTTLYDRLSLLHIAAANGRLEVGSLLPPSKESSFLLLFSGGFSVDFFGLSMIKS